MRFTRLLPAELNVWVPDPFATIVEPVRVNVSRLVKSKLPPTVNWWLEISRVVAPPLATEKLPWAIMVSVNAKEPLVLERPTITLLKLLPAEVKTVLSAKFQVEPVVVKVSAWVRVKVFCASILALVVFSEVAPPA